MNKKYIGSKFDDFLADENLLADSQAEAIKRVIAWQLGDYIERKGSNKSVFASELSTSRSQLNRLLDPKNTSLNLRTLCHAAEAMGKHIEIRFVDER